MALAGERKPQIAGKSAKSRHSVQDAPVANRGDSSGYEASRLNATKHAILSEETVLPLDDRSKSSGVQPRTLAMR